MFLTSLEGSLITSKTDSCLFDRYAQGIPSPSKTTLFTFRPYTVQHGHITACVFGFKLWIHFCVVERWASVAENCYKRIKRSGRSPSGNGPGWKMNVDHWLLKPILSIQCDLIFSHCHSLVDGENSRILKFCILYETNWSIISSELNFKCEFPNN